MISAADLDQTTFPAKPNGRGIRPLCRPLHMVVILLTAILIAVHGPPAGGAEPSTTASPIAEFRGRTMGTTYSVKAVLPMVQRQDLKLAIDRELRRVNSQMSTYLQTSEITKFNQSRSTDWFAVSAATVKVVSAALEVSRATNGAFDVTAGPLIELWSFGAGERTQRVPSEEELALASENVGYSLLKVREQPPAIAKLKPDVAIDLSAIAKGHGVDRIAELLIGRGIDRAFVEIGGEVRTLGKKPSGEAWRVGIQKPDAGPNDLLTIHAFDENATAMATSGDYRNFFEVDGQRYSHTIDPRTRQPIRHSLASVTVVGTSCMMADGWATALSVLGPRDGRAVAAANDVQALLVSRENGNFQTTGTGMFAQVAGDVVTASQQASGNTLAPMFVVTLLILGAILAAMAVGVMFGRRAISGSCGGLASMENEDGSVSCSLCSNPADACKELRQRMKRPEGVA